MEKQTEQNEQDWDIVISDKNNNFSLHLDDVWRYRDLLILFVKRDIVAFYKQTILGPVWYFVQPIFTVITYTFIFGRLAGISTDGLPKPLFYLAGVISWSYFSDCLLKTSTVFKDNANIFSKVYFPRLIMPLSIVISNLARFGIQMMLFAIIIAYYIIDGTTLHIDANILLFPILVLLMAAQGLGWGMIVSALTTKYRDLALLLSFGIQLLMYSTTVVYPLSSLPLSIRNWVALNPLTPLVEGMRKSMLGVGDFTPGSLLYAGISTIVIFLAGILIFNKVEKNFVDTI